MSVELQKEIESIIAGHAFKIVQYIQEVQALAENPKYKSLHPQMNAICGQILDAKIKSFRTGTQLIIDGPDLVKEIHEEATKPTAEDDANKD